MPAPRRDRNTVKWLLWWWDKLRSSPPWNHCASWNSSWRIDWSRCYSGSDKRRVAKRWGGEGREKGGRWVDGNGKAWRWCWRRCRSSDSAGSRDRRRLCERCLEAMDSLIGGNDQIYWLNSRLNSPHITLCFNFMLRQNKHCCSTLFYKTTGVYS